VWDRVGVPVRLRLRGLGRGLAVLAQKLHDALGCGCLFGLVRVARRVAVADDPIAVFTSKRTWLRFAFDLKIALASGLLLGTAAVILAVIGK
jgi:hypothetical protein